MFLDLSAVHLRVSELTPLHDGPVHELVLLDALHQVVPLVAEVGHRLEDGDRALLFHALGEAVNGDQGA